MPWTPAGARCDSSTGSPAKSVTTTVRPTAAPADPTAPAGTKAAGISRTATSSPVSTCPTSSPPTATATGRRAPNRACCASVAPTRRATKSAVAAASTMTASQ